MRKTLLLLTIFCVALIASAQNSNSFKRNKRQQRALEHSIKKLETNAILGDIWGTVCMTDNDAPWIMNHYLTTDELWSYADSHHSPNVRAVAIHCLMERYPRKSKELFFRHVTESAPIHIIGGCILYIPTLGDYLIQLAQEQNYLTADEWHKTDSLLLHSADAVGVRRRIDLITRMPYSEIPFAELQRISQQRFDPVGLQLLAMRQAPQDTTLVLQGLDTVYRMIWGNSQYRKFQRGKTVMHYEEQMVNVARSWQHSAFERRIIQMRDSLTAQGIVPSECLFSIAFALNPKNFPVFVEECLRQIATHPDNKKNVERPNGSLVAKTVTKVNNTLEFKRYNWEGFPVYGCRFHIYDPSEDASTAATRQLLQKY